MPKIMEVGAALAVLLTGATAGCLDPGARFEDDLWNRGGPWEPPLHDSDEPQVDDPGNPTAMAVEEAIRLKPVISVVFDTPGRLEWFVTKLGLTEDEEEELRVLATRERLFDAAVHQQQPTPDEWNQRARAMAEATEDDLRLLMGTRYSQFLELLQDAFDEDSLRTPGPQGDRSCLAYTVYGTQYEAYTAYEVAVPDKYVKWTNLAWGSYAGYDAGYYDVQLDRAGYSTTVWVGDVGPWNIDDNYWNPVSGPRPRRMFTDLAQGYPEAQAAYYDGYNGGLDQYSRTVLNPAGVDLSPDVATDLGLPYLGNDWITVTFLWECTEDDADGDGYTPGAGDCNDGDASVYPGAPETCDDGIDQDCDGADLPGSTWYYDNDGDGYGDTSNPVYVCGSPPSGTTQVSGDCNDGNASVHPGAAEVCDGIVDNNCDGVSDPLEVDDDGDGVNECNGDCDDTDPNRFPGNPEICDHIDNDCDDIADEGLPMDVYWTDADGDGYGDPASPVIDCGVFAGHVDNELDCDDADPNQYPGAPEVCNYEDDDCDGEVDEGVRPTFYWDGDLDGWCNVTVTTLDFCSLADANATAVNGQWGDVVGDCDDENADIHPEVVEVCDGVDNDCDGVVDDGTCTDDPIFTDPVDGDGDGFVEALGDCDDGDWTAYPGAEELCDGVDNDCDGEVDEVEDCQDADGDGYSPFEGDCDDANPTSNPAAEEVLEDGRDNDCDGEVDEDPDRDFDLDGYSETEGDCNDGDSAIHPGAMEDPYDMLDNDCDGIVDESIPAGCSCEHRPSSASGGWTAVVFLLALGWLTRRQGP